MSPPSDCRNSNTTQELTETPELPLARALAHKLEKDPALARIVDAWPDLPEPIRAGILAMVAASLP